MTTLGPALEKTIEQSTDPVGEAGTAVSTAIHNAVLKGGPVTRRLADILHGTWLGHPLHPVLTDVTIGAWSLAIAFDATGEWTDDQRLRFVADRLVEAGLISSIPTALSGLADYSTFPQWSANAATIHGVANLVNIVLYGLSVRDRRAGRRMRGVMLSTLGFALSGFSAWLGGALVYKHRVAVDHADRFGKTHGWKPVLNASALHQRKLIKAKFENKPILLYREADAIYAIGDRCSHAGGPLHEGKVVSGPCVQCPWHDSVFDLRDGSIVHGPATQPQARFAARIREGQVEVRVVESTPPED